MDNALTRRQRIEDAFAFFREEKAKAEERIGALERQKQAHLVIQEFGGPDDLSGINGLLREARIELEACERRWKALPEICACYKLGIRHGPNPECTVCRGIGYVQPLVRKHA